MSRRHRPRLRGQRLHRPRLRGPRHHGPRPTARGAGLVVCGVALGVIGHLLASTPIVFVGVALVVLVVAAVVSIAVGSPRFAVSRTFSPSSAVAGRPLEERLTVTPLSASARGRVRLVDGLPWNDRAYPESIVVDLESGRSRTTSIPLDDLPRGRHLVGPLGIDLVESFGLATRRVVVPGLTELVVVPESSGARAGGASHSLGEGSRIHRDHSVASSEDDPITREYRRGDAMRRVHWKATARQGELMVRQEEQHGLPGARVVLCLEPEGWQDARHTLRSRSGELVSDGFEWAVSAAATIAVQFGRAGAQTRLLAIDGDTVAVHDPSTTEIFLELLADVRLGATGFDRTPEPSPREPVVAIVSTLLPGDVARLGHLRGPGVRGVAIVLGLGPLPFEAPGRLAPADVSAALAANGWRVIDADLSLDAGAVIDDAGVLRG